MPSICVDIRYKPANRGGSATGTKESVLDDPNRAKARKYRVVQTVKRKCMYIAVTHGTITGQKTTKSKLRSGYSSSLAKYASRVGSSYLH